MIRFFLYCGLYVALHRINRCFVPMGLIFISTFNNCGNHFKLLIGIKKMP